MSNLDDLFLLDPDVVFLNHGSFGACPRPVFEDYQNWQRELERQPVAFLGSERGLVARMREARSVLAAELGTAPENIAAVVNATTGLNIVAQSLELRTGDEILTTDHEYAALEKTWDFICRRTGARVVVAEIPLPLTSREMFEEAVLARMTERTKVLFLSHITSPTALLLPLERLVAEARERDIISMIDGAHAPGHVPLDLDALGADFYSGNCHKWMMAPKGSAFVYVRPEWQSRIDPLVVSHGWTSQSREQNATGPFGNRAFIDMIEMQGTRDPAAFLSVPSAIRFRREHDWGRVQKDCERLAQETAARIRRLTGLPALSSPEFSAPQMISMPIPACDVAKMHDDLLQSYGIEIPVIAWKDRHLVRLSCQGYNTRAQMDVLIEALTTLLSLDRGRLAESQA